MSIASLIYFLLKNNHICGKNIGKSFYVYIDDTLGNNQYFLKAFRLILLCNKRIYITFDKINNLTNY